MQYPSKLLLFGEHTINRGSDALAIPYPALGGTWAYSADFTRQQSLPGLVEYLAGLQKVRKLQASIDLEAFPEELARGLYFDSTIPVGYGLGSSGALCAAVYDRFGTNKMERTDNNRFPALKSALAQIECFFHGSSSGIDPLISYLQQPTLIRARGEIETVVLPKNTEITFFLLDTALPRNTSPLVQYFLKRCEEPDFVKNTLENLVNRTNSAIDTFLKAEWKSFYENVLEISHLQIMSLSDMIPIAFHDIWKAGWKDDLYCLKMCGAGGGGFILGATLDWEHTHKKLAAFQLQRILL